MTQMTKRIVDKLLKLWGLATVLLLAKTRFAMADALGILDCPYINPKKIIEAMSRRTCGFSGGSFDPNSNCFWFSKGLRHIFEAMDQIGSAVYDSLAGTNGKPEFAIPVLAVCFGVWLAWQVLRYVGPVHYQAPSDFFEIIAHGFFRLLVVCCLIKWGASEAFENFIGLFAVAAANIGTEIMSKASQVLEVDGVSEFNIANWDNLSGVMKLHAAVALNLKMAASSFMEIVGMGYVLIQFAFNDGILCLLPSLDPLWTGEVLIFAAIIFVFIIPFKFLDILFRLTLVYALLPMFLVAWVFPSTRKYSIKAWGVVMNAVCLLLIMSVLFALCTSMISNLLLSGSTDSGALNDPKILYNLFRTDESCEDKNMLLIMLVAIFLAIKSLNLGKELAGHLSETPSGSVADGTLNAVAGQVGASAAGAAMAGLGLAGSSILDGMSQKMKSLGNHLGNAGGKVAGRLAGVEPSGGSLSPRLTARFNVAGGSSSGGSIGSSNMEMGASGRKGGGSGSGYGAAGVAGAGMKAGGAVAGELGDVKARLEEIEKQNADLEKEIKEKLSFMTQDILDNMDFEHKKGLADMARALDMAKQGYGAEGRSPEENKHEARNAERILRYAAANNLNGQPGDVDNFAKLCDGMKGRLTGSSDKKSLKVYREIYGESAKNSMMNSLKGEAWARQFQKDHEALLKTMDEAFNEAYAKNPDEKRDISDIFNADENVAKARERMKKYDHLFSKEGRNSEMGIAFNKELNKLRGGEGGQPAADNLVQEMTNEAVRSDASDSNMARANLTAKENLYKTMAEDDRKEDALRKAIDNLKGQRSDLKRKISGHKNEKDSLEKELENLEKEKDDLEKAVGETDLGEGINTKLRAMDENGKPIDNNTDNA